MLSAIIFHKKNTKKHPSKFILLKSSNLTDEKLITLYLTQGDKKCIEQLLGRYIRFVIAVCVKYVKDEELAKDLAMQVFEKVIVDLPRFEIANFKSWLYTVTRNCCMMHFRTQKNNRNVILSSDDFSPQIMEINSILHLNDEETNNTELKLQQLEEALIQLDEEQKACIELFYLKDKSYKEVVETTGLTINQVKSNIQNGKRNLKNYLLKHGKLELILFVILFLDK
jgi:RNA polymerase sigma factor (sigma-70 family)